MNRAVAVLASLFALAFAESARADDATYTLHEGRIVIHRGDVHVEQKVECNETLALVQRGAVVHVACGKQGLATYALDAPTSLRFVGVTPTERACIDLAFDGACVLEEPPPPPPKKIETRPVSLEPIDTTERDVGTAIIAVGVVAIGTGAFIGFFQGMAGFGACFTLGGCNPGPPKEIGYAALTLLGVGAGFVLIGLPIHLDGAANATRTYVYATPSGGGLRVTF